MTFDWRYLIAIVAIVAVVIIGIIYAYRDKIGTDFLNSETVKAIIRRFIMDAEEYLKSEAGEKRLDWCIERVHRMIPPYLKPYITEKMIKRAIQTLFDQMAVIIDGHRVPKM